MLGLSVYSYGKAIALTNPFSKKQAANKDAFMESFAELVKIININTDLVDSVIEFNTAKYNSTDVFGSPRFCMYVNSWMPNQMTSVHQHFRYSTFEN